MLIVNLLYANYEAELVFPAGIEVKREVGEPLLASTLVKQILLLSVLYLLWDQIWVLLRSLGALLWS